MAGSGAITPLAAETNMAMKHLLVHVDSGERSRARLGLAVDLARRFDARLAGLFAEESAIGSSAVGRRSPQNMARARGTARELFEAATREARLDTEWWEVEQGESAQVVGWTIVCCRHVDLAIFGQHDPASGGALSAEAIEQVLMECGRPLLVVPYAGCPPAVGRRVLVVWTGSREAARAVADAVPLLAGAEEVTLVAVQRPPAAGAAARTAPGPNIGEHLRTHGITVRYEKVIVDADDVPVVDTVLNHAAESVADLIVLGGHLPFGFPYVHRSNTTRDILRTMTVPVLLSR